MEMFQKVSAKGLVCKDNKIFMLKDHRGYWELPGGGIEVGEHPSDAILREFDEELGVKNATAGDLLNVWDFTNENSDSRKQYIIIIYECNADLSKIKISDEHFEYKWIDLKKISEFSMRDGYRDTIEIFKRKNNL